MRYLMWRLTESIVLSPLSAGCCISENFISETQGTNALLSFLSSLFYPRASQYCLYKH
jgi:hypothetical protein